MAGKGLGRIRLTSDATTLGDLRRKYAEAIRRVEKKELSEKEAKALSSLLNGLRDLILRGSRHSPMAKNLKKKTGPKLKEWNKDDGS